MVRALLAGTKTQTRRPFRVQPSTSHWETIPGYELKRSKLVTINERVAVKMSHTIPQNPQWDTALDWLLCPYGQPGDRLWVKETFYAFGRWETRFSAKKGRDEWHFIDMTLECGHAYHYDAEDPVKVLGAKGRGGVTPMWWKRPAIFMPRAASRILLEVTDVRVERLQDISEADAIAEGIIPHVRGGWHWHPHDPANLDDWHQFGFKTARYAYESLWESINGAGSWDANPWVWTITFRKTTHDHT